MVRLETFQPPNAQTLGVRINADTLPFAAVHPYLFVENPIITQSAMRLWHTTRERSPRQPSGATVVQLPPNTASRKTTGIMQWTGGYAPRFLAFCLALGLSRFDRESRPAHQRVTQADWALKERRNN